MEDYKVGALIEDFQSKLDIVCEGIKINRELTEVFAIEQKKQGEDINTIKIGIMSLEKGQANFEKEQEVIKDKIINLENGQDIIKDDLTEVKSMLHRKVDIQEFERLEKRVIKLERLAGAV